MKLAYWMYAGPAHIGTLRVASSFKNVHSIMHAPLGRRLLQRDAFHVGARAELYPGDHQRR
jgi:hypothetical protein